MASTETVYLRKNINLLGSMCLIIGTIVGSGIFIAPKGILKNSGNIGMSLIIWLATGIISTFGALCYAELGTSIKKSGGQYIYLLETLGPMPAFLRLWAQYVLIWPGASSVVALAFGRYIVEPFFSPCPAPEVLVKMVSITGVSFVVAVNCWSVNWATRLQILLTAIKMGALVLIIVPGMIRLASEEIIDSKRNIPLSIILSMVTVTIAYLLANISYYTVMTSQDVLESNAVAMTFADRALQGFSSVIPILVAVSCLGAIMGGCFTTPRMLFSGAREGHWPVLFAMIHIRRHTPLPVVLLMYPTVVFMILAGELFGLLNFYSFSRWLFMGLNTIGLMVHRYRNPDLPRPFKVHLFVPAVFTIVCFFVVGMSLYSDPFNTGSSFALVLIGVPIYFLVVQKQRLPVCIIRAYCSIVGSGIFIAPKGILRNSGNVGLSLIIWLATGILSTFGALCFAELGTCIKKSGAHYIYILETLGPMPAFLRLWAQFIVIRPASTSVVALAFGRYIVEPFYSPCSAPKLLVKIVSIIGVSFAVAVNCWSVTCTTRLQMVLSTVKMGALVLIIVPGMIKLASGQTENFHGAFDTSSLTLDRLPLAFYAGLYAYAGSNLPLSIILSMVTVTIAYLLTNISYYTVMTFQEVLESNAVAVTFADRALQGFSSVIPVLVAVSCFGSLIGGCFATPSSSRWMFTALTALGLIVHRYQHPDLPRPFKVHLLIPAVYTVVCFFIVGMSLYSDPVNTGIGFALTLTGIPVYFLMVQKQRLPLCFIRAYRALCFAELGTCIKKSGAHYIYILETLGPMPAFLRLWAQFILIQPASTSVVALAFGCYIVEPFYSPCSAPKLLVKIVSIIGVSFAVAVNCWSVTCTTRLQIVLTTVKMGALVLIIVPGMIKLASGQAENFHGAFDTSSLTLDRLPLAFYAGLYAYAGSNLPLSIILSMVTVTIFYLLTNISYYMVMTSQDVLESNAVAVTFADRALQGFSSVIPVLVAVSCFGSLIGGCFATPRMLFSGSREGQWPVLFSMIHIRRHTPLPAVLLMYPLMVFMIFAGELFGLINFYSFSRWMFTGLTALGLIVHRYQHPDLPRPFKVHLLIPAVYTVVCFFIVGMSLYSDPVNTGIGFALTLTGIPVYFLMVQKQRLPLCFIRAYRALCYAELGTCIKKSGAHYIYILETLGPMLAFLRLWAQFILIRPASLSVVALAFGRYIVEPFYIPCTAPKLLVKIVSIIGVSFAVAVNCWSVTCTTRLQIVLTTVKMGALVLIIVPGMIKLASGQTENFHGAFDTSSLTLDRLPLAFYAGLYAYAGSNIPLSIILSMVTVTIAYLLTNISYYTVMTSQEVLESNAVAVTFADRALQGFSSVIPVLVAVSCFGSLIGGCFATPRMLFSGSREGQWPVLFSMIHIRRHTPLPAVLLMVHLLIPAVYTVVCFFIVGMSLYSDPVNTGIGFALTLTGIPVYFLMVQKQRLPLCFIRAYRK
ncbi:XCT protein, partial [Polypterus senegalus]|nr:XCT protein [Polypterus senegalus]